MVGQLISRYRILEKLGRGGMGVVYKAEDARLGRKVALKFLPDDLAGDQQALDRFRREARAASALNHPNICTIYDVDEFEGRPFLVMELLDGQTLSERVAGKPLETARLLDLGIQITDALQAAHARGIIHRDIKPANIVVTAAEQVKILDFGLAKLVPRWGDADEARKASLSPSSAPTDPYLTARGVVVGTVSYMSPEQARGEDVDSRTDLFSFGAVLYEMATGAQAFSGNTNPVIFEAVLSRDPIPARQLNPQVAPDLEHIIHKALEKDRTVRYQTATDLLADLRRLKRDSESGRGAAAPFVTTPTPARRARRGKPGRIRSLAVLPLADLSRDRQDEFFADGMTEELITELAQIGALRVISRTSAMLYKGTRKPLPEIARELNVDAVVEGSVLRSGGRVRITAQLIHAATDQHLWAKSYERDLQDILTLQREVAQAIAEEIKVKLTPQEQARLKSCCPVKPEIYELYLKGRYHWNKFTEEGFRLAVQYFQQAIEQDPTSALAYAGLADVYCSIGFLGLLPPNDVFPRGKAAAAKALALDNSLAPAYAASAIARFFYDWDWLGAEREIRQALARNPGYAVAHYRYGFYYWTMGQMEEALREMQRALELDPLCHLVNSGLGWTYFLAGQIDQAIAQHRKSIEMDPDFWMAYWGLGAILLHQGRHEEALTHLEKAVSLSGGASSAVAELGRWYAITGQTDRALEIIEQLKERSNRTYVPSYDIAMVYVGLGDTDKVLEWLEKAYQEHSAWLVWLHLIPWCEPLHPDPRFQDLVRRIGLPQRSAASGEFLEKPPRQMPR